MLVYNGDDDKNFKVRVQKSEVVAPALPLQDHWLPLSNLDLLLPPVEVGLFFCYSIRPGPESESGPEFGPVLKTSLAQALVSFYPFAGELVENSEGEPELHCNNRGVEFVEASADVTLADLDLYNPDESVEGKLVPRKKHGVLAVQVTELKCGGVVVSCTFDHRVADAYSANMFVVSWAATAHPNKQTQSKPSFRRSLLNPRRPGKFPASIDATYVPVSSLHGGGDDHRRLVSRIYHVKAEELDRLQTLTDNGATKLESFCAFLWKLVAAEEDRRSVCRMGIVVDGRSRLAGPSPAMKSYFGNVLSIPFGSMAAEDLSRSSLAAVVEEVRRFLSPAATEDHFLGLVDWVEAHRPEPGLARIYCRGREGEGSAAFVVSSGQRFPVSEVDFGWGGPVFGSYHFPWGGDAGYVMPMPSPAGNGDWVVYMHLSEAQIQVVERVARRVFTPFSFACLDSKK